MPLAGGAACAALACWQTPSRRDARDFERMRHQQRYDAYDASRFFANGAVMQAPPTNTVARDDSGRRSALNGQAQYEISCAPCHGSGGFGGGPMAPNLGEKRPPSLRSAHIASTSPAELMTIVTAGIGRMPPLGWQLTPAARAAVLEYVRNIATAPPTAAMWADSAEAARLQRLDSLEKAGASVRSILQLPIVRR
jgi:mono/diheme cytochrome c family protein